MHINADYPRPIVVNGFACHNCDDVSQAKRGVDPAEAANEAAGKPEENDKAVLFGGSLADARQASPSQIEAVGASEAVSALKRASGAEEAAGRGLAELAATETVSANKTPANASEALAAEQISIGKGIEQTQDRALQDAGLSIGAGALAAAGAETGYLVDRLA